MREMWQGGLPPDVALIKGKNLRLCKRCYDYETDRELAMCTEPQA